MRQLRGGIIGCGAIGREAHIPALQAAGVEVAAVCDPAPGRARAVAREFGIGTAYRDAKRLLERDDLDFVVIGAPNAFHAPLTIAALEAGKHVLCEKPIAVTSVDAERMVAAARAAGLVLGVNQHMRFDPSVIELRRAASAGEFGDVYVADVRWTRAAGIPGYGSWFTRRELAGAGALFDIGVHMLDLALWLLDFPAVERVQGALSGHLGEHGLGRGGWGIDRKRRGVFDVDDTAVASLRLAGGGTLRLHVAWASFGVEEQRVTLHGTRGGADYCERLYGTRAPLRFFSANGGDTVVERRFAPRRVNRWSASLASFLAAVRGESDVVVRPEETVTTLRVLEAIAASSAANDELVL